MSQKCYSRQGHEQVKPKPCSLEGSGGPDHCCGEDWHCASNGLCVRRDGADQPYAYSIGSCTDPDWNSPTCLSQCREVWFFVESCPSISNGFSCVESDQNYECNTSSDLFFTLDPIRIIESISLPSSSEPSPTPSSSPSSATSASASASASSGAESRVSSPPARDSTTTNGATPTPSSNSANGADGRDGGDGGSNGLAIGLGAGLGGALLIALAVIAWLLFLLFRRRRRRRHNWPDKITEGHAWGKNGLSPSDFGHLSDSPQHQWSAGQLSQQWQYQGPQDYKPSTPDAELSDPRLRLGPGPDAELLDYRTPQELAAAGETIRRHN